MMTDKRGKASTSRRAWIRILESAIAVMLLIGFFTVITMKHVTLPDVSEEVYALERTILVEVSENDDLRWAVFNKPAMAKDYITNYIGRRLDPSISFSVNLCGITDACEATSEVPTDKDVFTDDYFITNPDNTAQSRLIKLFVWFEEPPRTVPDVLPVTECGDGYIEGREDCEPSTYSNPACSTLGLGTGSLACYPADSPNECMIDTTSCSEAPAPYCGDNIIQTAIGEECEPSTYTSELCSTRELGNGYLSCYSVDNPNECTIDTSGCEVICNWVCTPWSLCLAGIQTRTCTNPDGCTTESPETQKTCEICTMITFYLDSDSDNYGSSTSKQDCQESPPAGYVTISGDCDDTKNNVNPGMVEGTSYANCADGLDNDCDGYVDSMDIGCQ